MALVSRRNSRLVVITADLVRGWEVLPKNVLKTVLLSLRFHTSSRQDKRAHSKMLPVTVAATQKVEGNPPNPGATCYANIQGDTSPEPHGSDIKGQFPDGAGRHQHQPPTEAAFMGECLSCRSGPASSSHLARPLPGAPTLAAVSHTSALSASLQSHVCALAGAFRD